MRIGHINFVLERAQDLILSDTDFIFDAVEHFLIEGIIGAAAEAHDTIEPIDNILELELHVLHLESQYHARQYDHESLVVDVAAQVKEPGRDL